MWQQSQRPICSEHVKVNDIMAEETVLSTGSLQQFLNVTQDHLWCLFAISFIPVLLTAIFPIDLEICRNAKTSFWWSFVGQQINVIDADNVGGPPGSPDGFVEIKQFFLLKIHVIRKLVSGYSYNQLRIYSVCSSSKRQKRRKENNSYLVFFFQFQLFFLTERKEKHNISYISQTGKFQRKSLLNKRVL